MKNIEVTTNYIPDVAESKKIDIQPTLEEPKVETPTYNYIFPNAAYKPKSVYSPIDPIFIKKEPVEELYDNYIEIGGGNYLTSYLDANIYNTHDKYYTYGLQLNHHAASASKNPNQALYSQNRIKAFGLREKGNDLYADIDYQRNVVHYYGYLEDSTSREFGDLNQIYNDLNATAEWSIQKRKIENVLDFDFNLFDKLGENENTFRATNTSSLKLGSGKLHIDLGAMYTTLTETAIYDRLFIDIRPHYEFDYKKYTLDLGITLNYLNDFGSINVIYPAPFVKAETYIVPDKLRAYLGVTGELEKNTLRSLSYENLFLGNNTNYTNPRGFQFYGGMNGSFKRFIEFGIKLQHEIIQDQYFFINDTNTLRNFTTVYDDLNRTTISGEVKFDVNQNIDLGFRGNFYSYQPNKENEAWHMPTYDASLFTTVRIADKIYINGGYFATSSRKSRDLSGTEYSLAAINDINVGAEYRYKKNISGFINVNNILNQRYELWNFYRAQGLNVLAGVTFSL
ncbi:MAG TPA: hypothetical protein DCY51_05670 [Bacteroidetes bacterium]|nr:hypothetical protein [Bacteroidota bacterium]